MCYAQSVLTTPTGTVTGNSSSNFVGINDVNPNAQLSIKNTSKNNFYTQLRIFGSAYDQGLVITKDIWNVTSSPPPAQNFLTLNSKVTGDFGNITKPILNVNATGNLGLYVDESTARFHLRANTMDYDIVKIEKEVSPGDFWPVFHINNVGETRCREVYVDMQQWYDHVFEEDYELMPLNELEEFVNTEKHLPEIPSEAEVKEEGINLAVMNALLLKKVEELTLHVIELYKEVEALKVEDEIDDNVLEENDAERKIEKQ